MTLSSPQIQIQTTAAEAFWKISGHLNDGGYIESLNQEAVAFRLAPAGDGATSERK